MMSSVSVLFSLVSLAGARAIFSLDLSYANFLKSKKLYLSVTCSRHLKCSFNKMGPVPVLINRSRRS